MTRPPLPSVSHTVTAADIEAYAELSGDRNPLHVDRAFAAAGPFGAIVAHGPIALQTIFEAVTRWLGSEDLPAGALVDVAFRAPVREGDTVTCTGRVLEEHAGDVVVRLDAVDQHGAAVVEALVVVPRWTVPAGAAG